LRKAKKKTEGVGEGGRRKRDRRGRRGEAREGMK